MSISTPQKETDLQRLMAELEAARTERDELAAMPNPGSTT